MSEKFHNWFQDPNQSNKTWIFWKSKSAKNWKPKCKESGKAHSKIMTITNRDLKESRLYPKKYQTWQQTAIKMSSRFLILIDSLEWKMESLAISSLSQFPRLTQSLQEIMLWKLLKRKTWFILSFKSTISCSRYRKARKQRTDLVSEGRTSPSPPLWKS